MPVAVPAIRPSHGFNNPLGRGFVPPVRSSPGSHFYPQPMAASPLALFQADFSPVLPVPPYPFVPYTANTPVWPTYKPLQHCVATPQINEIPFASSPLMNASTMLPARWAPGTFPAEQFGVSLPLQLHPHLIYNPNNPSIPPLQWDLIHRPELARVYTGRHNLVSIDLKEQAIVPSNVRTIHIYSDHSSLEMWMRHWGPIVIDKSKKITIRDVLDAIYDYFQRPLTKRDVRWIQAIPGNIANLSNAAHDRVKDSYEIPSVGLQNGFKRIDAIGGHRRFQGLRPVIFQNNTWKLFLGLLPGPVPRLC